MKSIYRTLFPIVGMLWLAVAGASNALAPAAQQNLIHADHKYYLYTGRVDFANKQAPRVSWPGTSIKANISGHYVAVVLDDELGKNYFSVIVNGETQHPFVIEAKQGEHTYEISRVLGEGPHSIEVYKRTEGEEGGTAFKGLVLAEGESLLPPPARPSRRIEIYGDSITSGMGNEGADNARDDLLSEKNHYWAYSAITARNLNAELHTISQSGIGIMVSWFPFIMPQFYDQLSAVGNNDSKWDFSLWTPDVVVVNLFQNDSWLIDREKRLNPIPSDDTRIQAYMNFVRSIRAQYPEAHIICALGSMDATEHDKWPGYVTTAVERMKTYDKDDKLDTIFFPFTGYGQHPRIAQHKANAARLTAFIQQKMGW